MPAGAPVPGGGTTGAGPSGGMLPGSGVIPRSASAGAPSLGYPALAPGASLNTTGPQIIPPRRGIAPNKQVGPFTGGTSTENAWDPRSWFKANPNATFQAGSPMNGPGGPAAGAPGNPLSALGSGNPYWRGAIAGAGVMAPTPAETGELQPKYWPNPNSGQGGIGSDANRPVMGAAGFPTTYAPPGQQPPVPTPGALAPPSRPVTPTPVAAAPPSATPGPVNGRVNPASVNLGNNPWITGNRPNANPGIGGGMLGGGSIGGARGTGGPPQMGMLDLSQLFQHPAVQAAMQQNQQQQAPPSSLIPTAPPSIGPLQKGAKWPPKFGPNLTVPGTELGGEGTST